MLTPSPWIDSHCHLDLIRTFSESNELFQTEYLQELAKLGCQRILVPSTDGELSKLTLQLLQYLHSHVNVQTLTPALDISFGVHPWNINSETLNPEDLDSGHLKTKPLWQELHNNFHKSQERLKQLMPKLAYIAIGETGLDQLKYDLIPKKQQEESFEAHIDLAKQQSLPLIIHSVRTHADVLKALKDTQSHQGIIHGFTGSYEQAKQFIDQGFHIGVGGSITYPRAQKTRSAITQIPLDAIQLETDSPSMPLCTPSDSIEEKFKSEREENQPSNILRIASTLAELKGIDIKLLLKQANTNYLNLFRLGNGNLQQNNYENTPEKH